MERNFNDFKQLVDQFIAIGFTMNSDGDNLYKEVKSFNSVIGISIVPYRTNGENVLWVRFDRDAVINDLSDDYIKTFDEFLTALIDFCYESGRGNENARIAGILGLGR